MWWQNCSGGGGGWWFHLVFKLLTEPLSFQFLSWTKNKICIAVFFKCCSKTPKRSAWFLFIFALGNVSKSFWRLKYCFSRRKSIQVVPSTTTGTPHPWRHYSLELSSHSKPVNNHNWYHSLLTYCSGIYHRSSYIKAQWAQDCEWRGQRIWEDLCVHSHLQNLQYPRRTPAGGFLFEESSCIWGLISLGRMTKTCAQERPVLCPVRRKQRRTLSFWLGFQDGK